jgi:hypothetical protein
MKNIAWFKNEIAPILSNYEIEYKTFEEGDFGSLNQVIFNSDQIGGNIDFWGLNWLGIFLWDYQNEKELLNILLEPHQEEEKERAFKRLQELLQ